MKAVARLNLLQWKQSESEEAVKARFINKTLENEQKNNKLRKSSFNKNAQLRN